ncbi:MBL fold metallo-hydrolase [Streptomyces sp. NPDC051217]|uniref:MBL fold metallo-hydrolase n=1 Tax=Streptomyces sp. NPDC051217 TaxID=3365644 RepID=UPI0037B323AF
MSKGQGQGQGKRQDRADQDRPVVQTLLLGCGLSSDQGSIGFCGVYLVSSGSRRILFDCAHAGRRRALIRALARHELTVEDIDALVLSHAHWDHIQNADLFAHSDVFLHQAEIDHLAGAPLDDPVTPPWSAAIVRSLRVVEATDGLEIGSGVTITGLPGHTAGSIGLTVDTVAGTALVTGDAVSSARALRSGRCTVITAGEEAAAASMERVRSRAARVYPGHDRPFTVVAGVPGRYLLPAAELAVAPPDAQAEDASDGPGAKVS